MDWLGDRITCWFWGMGGSLDNKLAFRKQQLLMVLFCGTLGEENEHHQL